MLVFLSVIGFLLLFVIIWSGVCLLLAWIGGWARLARQYRAAPNLRGANLRGANPTGANAAMPARLEAFTIHGQSRIGSGRVGLINYNSSLTFRPTAAGLQLSVVLPFRIGHPPLFIPWTDFYDVTEKPGLLFAPSHLAVTIGRPPVARLLLPQWLGDYLRAC